MTLTPEQKKIVSEWVAAGDSLSTIQNKLRESFQVSLTYRDVRFLVDDLNLELKDAAPKVDTTDVTKAAAPSPAARNAAVIVWRSASSRASIARLFSSFQPMKPRIIRASSLLTYSPFRFARWTPSSISSPIDHPRQ